MKKGQEHGLVITPDIQEKNNIMYVAYGQALDAVREIARQAREFSSLNSDGKRAKLYSYSHNIIAFSGSRGQGKTSAMLSFSRGLASAEEKEKLEDCSFTILDPIDPTVLEENQGILAVILSRMYRLAERSWQESFKNHDPAHSHSEANKNAILGLFQKCLSGITAVKFRRGEDIKSLQIVHEISDSALLKENFYNLTEKLLHFTSPGLNGTFAAGHHFLVIQLDDTDFQIQKAYEILDDIRKYLTIPNVIILMATDMDLLRHTLTQHYLEEFNMGLKWDTIGRTEVRKLESKYLDKLIPPTFAVYLPHIDDLVRQQERLQLDYQDPEDPKRGNLLLPPNCPYTAADFSFQALVLRYIYQKTHIIFAEPGSHIHNLIPTTLRGLSQFLGLLSSMKDVPEVKLDYFPSDEEARKLPVEKARELAKLLAQDVLEESEVLETNLRLFEDYFLYDWVHTKLPKAESDIIEQLSRTMPGERCRAAIIALRRYEQSKEEPASDGPSNDYSYSVLVKELENRKGHNQLMVDFYFTFAIQTFFSIQFHKTVVYQKMRAAQAFLEDDSLDNNLLLFDFTPESLDLPWVYDDLSENSELVVSLENEAYVSLCKKMGLSENEDLTRILFGTGQKFNSMKLFAILLSLGSESGKPIALGEPFQKDLYLIQTSLVNIAINWDVQEKVMRLLEKKVRVKDDIASRPYPEVLKSFLTEADKQVKEINRECGTADSEPSSPMLSSHLLNVLNLTLYSETRSRISRIIRTAYESLGINYLNILYTIMESANQLKRSVTMKAFDQIQDEWIVFTEQLKTADLYTVLPDRWRRSQGALTRIYRYANQEIPSDKQIQSFIRMFDSQLEALYKNFGYTAEDIKKYGETRSVSHDKN